MTVPLMKNYKSMTLTRLNNPKSLNSQLKASPLAKEAVHLFQRNGLKL